METAGNGPSSDPLSAKDSRKRLISLAFLACAAISPMFSPTIAAEPPEVIAVYQSQPGEEQAAFILRVAIALRDWTAENGVEGCGYVTTNGHDYVVALTTDRSQLTCNVSVAADGYEPTGDTIHSHVTPGPDGRIILTDRTREVIGQPAVAARQVAGFSDIDYDYSRGWLVERDRLLYQSGRGTERVVTRLP